MGRVTSLSIPHGSPGAELLRASRARWLLVAGVVLTVVQLVHASHPALQRSGTVAAVIHAAACLAAGAAVACRAVASRADRAAWSCLAAGLLCYAGGFIVFEGVVQPLGLTRYPSPADALWFAFYPSCYLTIVLLLRPRISRWHRSLWLDGLVAALGFSALAVEVVDVLSRGPEGEVLRSVSTVAYPTGDLVLVAMLVASMAVLGRRGRSSLRVLGAGLLVMTGGDVAYLVQVDHGSNGWSCLTGATWSVAVLIMALASWRHDPELPPRHEQGWVVLLQPVFFTLLGAGLLVYECLEESRPDLVTVGLAFASVAAACGRMLLTYREVRTLADVREQARTDELTGLPNRRELDQRLRELEATGGQYGVLLVDLDRFKEVNDGFGHCVGDQLLVAVARRMTREVGQSGGTLVRMGGDEFGIVLPGADAAACSAVAATLHGALVEAFRVGGMALHVEASVGVAVSPEHGTDAGGLLRRADMAMYVAKRGHLGSHVFERGTEDDALVRLQTLEELRTALAAEEIVAFYQPQLDLRTGRIGGVEALARWQHPTRGLLGPGAFLDVAEQAGLVGPLFVRIAQCALRDARRWYDQGLELEVSVNVSAHEVQDPTLPDTVAALLEEAGLPGSVLKVEVTESVLMLNPERGRVVIDRLRALGVRMSLDDFGTGYSSLSYLPSLPVQELKLDRSFISSLTTDARAAAVVRSTLDLAHQLGLESVAEGIEDPEALALLADWGCDVAQGFYIAKPMAAAHLERWLGESPWLTSDVPVRAVLPPA